MPSVCQHTWLVIGLLAVAAAGWPEKSSVHAQAVDPATKDIEKVVAAAASKKPEFPPHAEVLSGYEKVISTADGKRSLYTIWVRMKDNQMLAELPKDYATQRQFFALTVASGDRLAGLQAGDLYVYWRRYDSRLALITPNIAVRSTGDPESKASVERLFTDRVLLEVPIVTLGPEGGPVIDMDALLVGKAPIFFGPLAANKGLGALFTITKAKAFPDNVELAFEVPTTNGQLQTLHYSISTVVGKTGYKTRQADERVGYFVTTYSDLGKYSTEETRVRYINRWHLEKADPKLKTSPPKTPIVFYIEHTTPVRYRRWVREGILSWNKAFEKIGLVNAIEVYFQDATTGAHMEKDPEDVRYNFVRWLNNDVGVAIGPSRVHPLTGQILDADIILTDGWIRHFRFQFEDLLPKLAMNGFSPETLSWLTKHPNWDPRIRLAPPSQREHLKSTLAGQGALPYGGHPMACVDSQLIGDQPYDGLVGRTSQVNGMCLAVEGKAFDVALMRMALAMPEEDENPPTGGAENDGKQDEKQEAKPDKEPKDLIDGMPESFIGPLLAHLVGHEVGHTLGLRHNFKGSSIYSLEAINSEEMKGKTPLASSVMDYTPVNINIKGGAVQGDYAMIGIGPYDYWAIEYGYSFADDSKAVLDRVAEPELQFATDEDTWGPDPLARQYDLGKNPLDYAQEQMRLVKHHREQLVEKFVKDGDSWSKARRGYAMTLSVQMNAVSMMANWIGGVHVYRDKKGDKNGRAPLEVVAADRQRAALAFVIDNTFHDDVYGLTPALLSRMTVDKWLDEDLLAAMEDPAWPVHDRIMGLQAAALTMIMNPTTLQRVYDNEFRVASDTDMITLPEMLTKLGADIWSELDKIPEAEHAARTPVISSLRRNLQREHLERLIDLSMPGAGSSAAYKPISDLARAELRTIQGKAKELLEKGGDKIDPYSKAHVTDIEALIAKVLDAQYIYNADAMGGSATIFFRFGKEAVRAE